MATPEWILEVEEFQMLITSVASTDKNRPDVQKVTFSTPSDFITEIKFAEFLEKIINIFSPVSEIQVPTHITSLESENMRQHSFNSSQNKSPAVVPQFGCTCQTQNQEQEIPL